jgi:hypothetical protein
VNKAEMAMDLADSAEALVRQAEAAVASARDPTQRDVAETQLGEALALQDQVLDSVAPVIEVREQKLRQAVREAVRSLQGDPAAPWHAKHRQHMSAAVKARLVGMMRRPALGGPCPYDHCPVHCIDVNEPRSRLAATKQPRSRRNGRFFWSQQSSLTSAGLEEYRDRTALMRPAPDQPTRATRRALHFGA